MAATGLAWPPTFTVESLATVEPRLIANHDDWEVLLALWQRGGLWGLVTNDERMLWSGREMAVLSRTGLTLVVTAGVGHDPLRATGMLMVHLPRIVRAHAAGPRIYVLRPGSPTGRTAGQQLNDVAQRAGIAPNILLSQELAAVGDLSKPVLP